MGITVKWDNEEKTVIRHTYKGNWTLDEYIEASNQTFTMIDEVGYPVHLLIIITEGVRPISDMMIAARDDRTKRHDRQSKVIIIGASSFMILLTRVISAIRPTAKTVKFVKTEAEAYYILNNSNVTNGNH